MPLAEGVGLAVGVLAWGDTLGFGLTWDPTIVSDGERLAAAMTGAAETLIEA